jgi:V/A-type H+-transporting ATPase subunit C
VIVSASRYAYLNARLSTLAARLIPPERLDLAIEQPPRLEPGSEYGTTQESFLADTGDQIATLEQDLLMNLWRDFLIITRPLSGVEHDFIVYGIHWFELANLKAVIRGKFSGTPDRDIREQLAGLGPFATLSLDELLRTEDPTELLRRLDDTPYADIARHARRTLEEQQDLFTVDADIGRRYYMGLQRRAREIAMDQRQAVMALTGFVLDRVNLLWLLRYRFAYNLSPAKTYYLLVPSTYRLTADNLQTLVQLSSLEEVLDALPAVMKQWIEGANTITEIEDTLEKKARQVGASALNDTRYPVARAYAYLVVREIEMRQILAIVKGRRLHFSPDLIRAAARTAS